MDFDIGEWIEGAAIVTVIGYGLLSVLSSLLVVVAEVWVLMNFWELMAWAETLGIIAFPAKIVIGVVAISGLGIVLMLVIIFLVILAGLISYFTS